MALAKLPSAVVDGVNAYEVDVEVDVASGLPGFVIVGLADKAVEESRERIRSALRHSGFSFPISRITVHLAPSELKKIGVHFDLAIALGVLAADRQIKELSLPKDTLFLGGLSLDGKLQPIRGALVMVEWAKTKGFRQVIVPQENFAETTLLEGIKVIGLSSLEEVVDFTKGARNISKTQVRLKTKADQTAEDWLQIQGQLTAKRAAAVAVAGGHNLILEGPPGAGKSLLAKGIRALMPDLSKNEVIEVVKLHSVAGELDPQAAISFRPPFRHPHHSASHVAIVGGGTWPRPGEISLAHRGVLFMDELPEFNRLVLEVLRQPLEDGRVQVSRVHRSAVFPADFLLVATMNPCPCGWYGSDLRPCRCSAHEINRYRKRISGPILDRIDIALQVPPVEINELRRPKRDVEELNRLRSLITQTRRVQLARNDGLLNSLLGGSRLSEICVLDNAAEKMLEAAAKRFALTGRGYHKALKVARTIADLNHHEIIEATDLAEALQYRQLATQS